jgi:hypothetical protein
MNLEIYIAICKCAPLLSKHHLEKESKKNSRFKSLWLRDIGNLNILKFHFGAACVPLKTHPYQMEEPRPT